MKKIIYLLVIIFSTNCFAIEKTVFKNSYPSFSHYQLLIFTQLRNYFEAFPLNSLNYRTSDGTSVYKIRGANANETTSIFSKITRLKENNQLIEQVSYFLEDGASLQYEIKKIGQNISNSNDNDLLTFKFNPEIGSEFYQITIPAFKIQLTHSKTIDGEKSLFYLNFMEFSLQIESHFMEREASLSYIYFLKEIKPDPQVILNVRAIETKSNWSGIDFIYSINNVGEITPKLFFKGLNDGSEIFMGASQGLFYMTIALGFPKL